MAEDFWRILVYLNYPTYSEITRPYCPINLPYQSTTLSYCSILLTKKISGAGTKISTDEIKIMFGVFVGLLTTMMVKIAPPSPDFGDFNISKSITCLKPR